MRLPRYYTLPAGDEILDTAPLQLVGVFDVARPSSEVWEELTAEHPLWWCGFLRDVTWTSPRPFLLGTTRKVRTFGNTIDEYFFRWEEGRRKSFCVMSTSVPVFTSLVEDYLVEPTSVASCRFTWTIAAIPHPLARPATPVLRRLLTSLFRDTRRHYGIE